jgi:hypothetical protein
MSLISLYTKILEQQKIDYDIVYMDKYGEKEEISAKNIFRYENIIDSSKPKWVKALKYWKFKKYAISVIEKNKYDFIVVWNDVAIFMFANYLAKKQAGKYCLNVRDYSHQKNRYVYNRFKKAINNSRFTTISSDGYKIFLPPFNYINVHSLNPELTDKIHPRTKLRGRNEPIRIGFIGNVRFFQINQQILDVFRNDKRFEIHYYGTNATKLEKYAQKNQIINAVFHDKFPVSKTADYLSRIDVINNLYGNDKIDLTTALSIKLYHAIYSHLPILVCPDTYMQKITEELKMGFVFGEITEKTKEDFYNWYLNLDFISFQERCEKYVTKIKKENALFENLFYKVISS